MNLYAMVPSFSPPVHGAIDFCLAKDDAEALEHAIYTAADDAVRGDRSLTADVYLIVENVKLVGEAHATDAPREWEWAHPGVEENVAEMAFLEAEADADWPA